MINWKILNICTAYRIAHFDKSLNADECGHKNCFHRKNIPKIDFSKCLSVVFWEIETNTNAQKKTMFFSRWVGFIDPPKRPYKLQNSLETIYRNAVLLLKSFIHIPGEENNNK